MGNKIKEYSNGEMTVVWKSDICIHAAECVKGLPKVFNPDKRPWVDISAAGSEELKKTIDRCPSQALSYRIKEDSQIPKISKEELAKCMVNKNGPLIVNGNIKLQNSDGNIIETKNITAFCRCGHSSKQPFCDGSHTSFSFE